MFKTTPAPKRSRGRTVAVGLVSLAALAFAGYRAQRWFYNPPRPSHPKTAHM